MNDAPRWHSLTVAAATQALASSVEGMASPAVKPRREEYGTNELPPPRLPSPWHVFGDQLKSPLVLILIIAAGVAFWLREWRDGLAIVIIVLINAVIGYRQEEQSDRALIQLLHVTPDIAHVLRDGAEREIPIGQVVVGNVVVLGSGDRIPADGRWVEVNNLRVNEASLTGESLPVVKIIEPLASHQRESEQKNMGWRGTTVVGGRGRLLVTAVGRQTKFGAIVTEVEGVTDASTPFQRKLNAFSRRLAVITLFLGLLVFWLGLSRQLPTSQVFLLSISLIVAVIPEGLPVVMTMAMAWGMWDMAKRQAMVRKLAAVETLGAVTVVATDKTGTLTYGEMMMERCWVDQNFYDLSGRGYDPQGDIFCRSEKVVGREIAGLDLLLKCGALNNDSRFTIDDAGQRAPTGDPTELALIVAAEKLGWSMTELEDSHPRLGEIPFDAKRLTMVTWHQINQRVMVVVKGAPHQVLEQCQQIWTATGHRHLTDHDRNQLTSLVETWANEALRVLAVAYTERDVTANINPVNIKGLIFIGMVGLADAIRPEAAETIASMHQAGIRTIMMTGDYRRTGLVLAQQLGMIGRDQTSAIIDGDELDQLDGPALGQRLATLRVGTSLTPEQKLRITRQLQAQGEIVAMTGDGINDVPTLIEANVGIAVGRSSSDAAKEAADVVLLDGNYQTVVAAIAEGRRIFRNIRRAIFYLLASNFAELGLIMVALMMGFPLPLLPTQIIWLNAIADPFIGIALAR